MGDGIGRAGFDAISAEDAAVVVDVVDLGIALGATDTVLLGVLCGLDVNAVGRARRRTQEAGYALLHAALVALQNVQPAETLLKYRTLIGQFGIGIEIG